LEKNLVSGTDLLTAGATSPSHEDIAALAYELWEECGGGDGGAEEDWFEAERQLRAPQPPLTVIVKAGVFMRYRCPRIRGNSFFSVAREVPIFRATTLRIECV
jgi:hypothetical protein